MGRSRVRIRTRRGHRPPPRLHHAGRPASRVGGLVLDGLPRGSPRAGRELRAHGVRPRRRAVALIPPRGEHAHSGVVAPGGRRGAAGAGARTGPAEAGGRRSLGLEGSVGGGARRVVRGARKRGDRRRLRAARGRTRGHGGRLGAERRGGRVRGTGSCTSGSEERGLSPRPQPSPRLGPLDRRRARRLGSPAAAFVGHRRRTG